MAQQNGFNAMFGITFEDFNSVKKKLDVLTNKINSETSKGIKFNIDNEQITRTISDLSKLARQNIQILPNGQITTLSKFNQELGKTIELKKNLTTGDEKISLSVDNDKIRKDTENMYADLFKQQEDLANMQQKITQQTRQQAQQEANENNRILEEKYRSEQELIGASQRLKQKSHQEYLKQAQQEAQIHNKLLTEKYSDEENRKQELADAQKLITFEKQRLEIKLNNIQANRKDLVNESYSNKIKDSISNLSGGNVSDVREKVRQLNLELQKLDQSARMKGLQVGNKNVMSLGESIKSTATKLGIFVSTAMVLNEVQKTIRNATSYIIELDKSMVNLKKVTDETSETYDRFLSKMHNVALQLGTQSNLMVDATTNWAKTGKSLEEASKLAENTILLTKVGDIDNVDTAQKYMVAPLKAFNIEAERSIELIDKYNNISNNMATTVQDVGEGLNIASNSLGVARNSLEQSIALISTAESTTKAGGSVIGNALKTISLRLASFKDDETGELIPNLADDLEELGVKATDSAGQIRSTFDILRDLGKIYEGLDTNRQLKLSEDIGGKRQANIVASILKNVDELDRAYGLATNSAGSALSEFEKYQQGIEYSLDQLKEKMNGLYGTFVNGGFFKGLINGAGDVISTVTTINKTIGTLPNVLVTVVGAMTIFNSKFRESTQVILGFNPAFNSWFLKLRNSASLFSQQSNLYRVQINHLKELAIQYQSVGMSTTGFGKQISTLNIKLALTTAKLIATKIASIALQTVLSMGLSFALTTVISGVTKLITSLNTGGKSMKDVETQATDLASSLDTISKERDLSNQYKDISNQLKNANLEESKRNDLKDRLDSVMKDLIASEKDYYGILNNENLTLDEQLEKMEQIRQLKLFDEAKELDEDMMSQGDIEDKVNLLKGYIQTYNEIQDALTVGANTGNYQKLIDLIGVSDVNEANQILGETKNKINELDGEVLKFNSGIKLMKDANYETSRSLITLDGETGSFISSLNKSTEATNENTKAKEENANAGGGDSKVDTVSVEEATKSYGKAVEEVDKLDTLLQKINKEQQLTPDIVSELSKNYSELGVGITDLGTVQEYLNNKIAEQERIQQEAYATMVNDDAEFYNSKIKNNETYKNSLMNALREILGDQAENYNIDLKNYKTLAELKSKITSDLGKPIAEWIKALVGGNVDAYRADLQNAKSFAEAKAKILQRLTEQINNANNALYNSASAYNKNMSIGAASALAEQLKNLQGSATKIETFFGDIGASFSGVNIPSFGVGSSLIGSDGDKKKTEKEIANMEKLSDRYLDVESALKQLDNELDRNKTLMDNSSDEEKLKYLDKELQLIQKQELALKNKNKEQKKELSELKNSLSANGFNADSSGNIINANNRLDALTNWANSLSGDDKENAQKNVKAIYESLKRYNELLIDQIPEVENKILDLKNTTIDTQKEIVELIKKQKDSYVENINKETEALKKAIQKRRVICPVLLVTRVGHNFNCR